MRRGAFFFAGLLGVVVVLPLLVFAFAMLALNTTPGERALVRYAAPLSGGRVRIAGVSGRFPDHLRLASLTLDDDEGEWLRITGLALDLDLPRLFAGEVRIARLTARRIEVKRLPHSSPAPSSPAPASSSAGGFALPLPVVLQRLDLARVELAAPVAGAAAVLAITGEGRFRALDDADARLAIEGIAPAADYRLSAKLTASTIGLHVTAREPPGGLAETLGHLSALGGLVLDADLAGPRDAAALAAKLTAGPLAADLHGRLDLDHLAGTLDFSATAPAMAPGAGISWRAFTLDAALHGRLEAPAGNAHLRLDDFVAGGARIAELAAQLTGSEGKLTLSARADAVRLPGPAPTLLAASPLILDATIAPLAADRPVDFTLSHPLLRLAGHLTTAGTSGGKIGLDLPDLAPFAAIGEVDLAGRAHFTLDGLLAAGGSGGSANLDGRIALTGGLAPLPALLGGETHLAAAARLDGADIPEAALTLDGQALSLAASGSDIGGHIALDWHLGLADFKVLSAAVSGALNGDGHFAGTPDDLAARARIAGTIAAGPVPAAPISVELTATGLPSAPRAHLEAQAMLDRTPLRLAFAASRMADGATTLTLNELGWKSLSGAGNFALASGAALPEGSVRLRMTTLTDLDPFLGQKISGSFSATAELEKNTARLGVSVEQASLAGGARVARAKLSATIASLLATPKIAARLEASGIAAGETVGDATLSLDGPENALTTRIAANVHNLAGAPATASSAALLDLARREVTLSALRADWHDESLRLLAPPRVAFADGVRIDRLQLGIGAARLDLAGRLAPALDATARLTNVTPALAAPFMPGFAASGVAQASARLTGPLARPSGLVTLTALGLHAATGPASALPPANLDAQTVLDGTRAKLDATLAAGQKVHLALSGPVPFDPEGRFALSAKGRLDLALLDPILTAAGRRVTGALTLDAGVAGTRAAPELSGSVSLAGGEVRDFAQGLDIRAITARISAAGQTLRVENLTAKAGQGALGGGGTVGVLAPGLPLDLTLTARDASPITTDQLTERLDADLHVSGPAFGALSLAGTIGIKRAEISIPDSLPPSVAVLNVRKAGAPPPAPESTAAGPDVALDLGIDAPRQIFIHGRGIDAELGGKLHVAGMAAAPRMQGGLNLIRGTVNLGGSSLNFTSGHIGFEGGHRIDPALNLIATSSNGNVTATLAVGGFASAPTITLSSTPPLPQDDILAHLLFGQSASQLSAFQLAEIAAGVAQLSGAAGTGGALNSIRSTLGLDRLAIGTPTNQTAGPQGGGPGAAQSVPTLEAGRYVAPGVYLGAKQGTTGTNDTQAELQIDLGHGAKLDTTTGSGYGANSVGLSYQFQY